MSEGGEPSQVQVAYRELKRIAKRFQEWLGDAIELGDLQGFGAPGVVEALNCWDGRGHFGGFCAQRIEYRMLDGLREHIRQESRANLRPYVRRTIRAALAAQGITDPLSDDLRREDDGEEVSLDDCMDRAAVAHTVVISAEDAKNEVLQVPDAAADVERRAELLRIRRFVEQLPEPMSQVAGLHLYQARSVRQTAAALDMPVSTVGKVLVRALALIEEQFRPEPGARLATVEPLPLPRRRTDPPKSDR